MDALPLTEWTYPAPKTKNFTLDDNRLEEKIPLDNGRHLHTQPSTDLGMLETLPTEILDEVLVQLDINTLTNLRSINRRMMHMIDSIPRYKLLIQHCPSAVRGTLALQRGAHISLCDLYRILITPNRENCGDFGGFISLLACKRVCFLCVEEEDRFYPMSVPEVVEKFAIASRLVRSLPMMRSIPGIYSPNEYIRHKRFNLLDFEIARHFALEHHGSYEVMKEQVSIKQNARESRHAGRRMATASESLPRSNIGDARRYMAVVAAPWFNPAARTVELGFHCVGCEDEYHERPLHWRRKYTAQTMRDHIEMCGRIVYRQHVTSSPP